MRGTSSRLPEIIAKHEQDLLDQWIKEQTSSATRRPDLLSEADLREQSRALLNGIRNAIQRGRLDDITGSEWQTVRDVLNEVSRAQAQMGFSPSEMATFVFSLKQPLFARLRAEIRETDPLGWCDRATDLPHDIARQLSITENTVKVHLRNILEKLHLRNRQQAAAFAISSGLVRLCREEAAPQRA